MRDLRSMTLRKAVPPPNPPVVGGWLGADLAADPQTWRRALPLRVADELLERAGEFVAAGVGWDPFAPQVAISESFRAFLAEVRENLAREPGFLLLTGFPTDGNPRMVEMAYWIFGRLIGPPVSQTRHGDLLIRVEDSGADITRPDQRGHRSASELPFHADRTDVIGLLCIRPATEGGLSRIVSSKALHNTVLNERPDLLPVLYDTFPNDQRGEEQLGQSPWCGLPVFSQTSGHFAARYLRRFIEGSQRHEQAPRLTNEQFEAMDLLDEILCRTGFALEMNLRPGDLQLINNMYLLHARTAFRDTTRPGRLLLRLWLSFDASPELPPEFASLYGRTEAGSYRGGVWPARSFEAFGRKADQR